VDSICWDETFAGVSLQRFLMALNPSCRFAAVEQGFKIGSAFLVAKSSI